MLLDTTLYTAPPEVRELGAFIEHRAFSTDVLSSDALHIHAKCFICSSCAMGCAPPGRAIATRGHLKDTRPMCSRWLPTRQASPACVTHYDKLRRVASGFIPVPVPHPVFLQLPLGQWFAAGMAQVAPLAYLDLWLQMGSS